MYILVQYSDNENTQVDWDVLLKDLRLTNNVVVCKSWFGNHLESACNFSNTWKIKILSIKNDKNTF